MGLIYETHTLIWYATTKSFFCGPILFYSFDSYTQLF